MIDFLTSQASTHGHAVSSRSCLPVLDRGEQSLGHLLDRPLGTEKHEYEQRPDTQADEATAAPFHKRAAPLTPAHARLPERCAALETDVERRQLLQVARDERRGTHRVSHALAGGELPGRVPEQVPLR
jgi:hypothetical protein